MVNHIFQYFLAFFNTREISTGFWLLVLLAYLFLSRKTRPSLIELFKAAFKWKLLLMFGTLAVYVTTLCWLLSLFNLWGIKQLGSSVLWFTLSGAVILGRSLSIKSDETYFINILKDNLKIAAIFEFIIVSYTFNIYVELALVPILSFIYILLTIANINDDYKPARRLLETITTVFVLFLLLHSLMAILGSPDSFFSSKTGRDFLLPLFLTVGCVPYFYLWQCISNLETTNIRIDLDGTQSEALKRQAKHRFFRSFFFRPQLLNQAAKQFKMMPPSTSHDVEAIIAQIRDYEENSKRPPAVDGNFGWSPYLAQNFLKSHGLKTERYHPSYSHNEWWASSAHVDLDDKLISSNVVFYLEGIEGLVTNLKLNGNFQNDRDNNGPIEKFLSIATSLIAEALEVPLDEAAKLIPDDASFEITSDKTHLSSKIEEYPTGSGFSWRFVISRNQEDL